MGLVLLAFLALAGSGPAAAGPAPVIRVGMETRAAPWAFVPGLDYSRENFREPPRTTPAQVARLQGFDVDVMNALAGRLGARMEVVPVSWFDIEKGLLAGRYDLILSSWTPTQRTPPAIASVPYCDWGLLIVVRSENATIRSYRDLEGVRVGHFPDPAVSRALTAMGHGRFMARDAPELLFEDLERGALDAVIYDSLYVRWRVGWDGRVKVVGEPLNRLGYYVGLRKEDPLLLRNVEEAVKDLVSSGERDRIRARWEGPGAPGPP